MAASYAHGQLRPDDRVAAQTAPQPRRAPGHSAQPAGLRPPAPSAADSPQASGPRPERAAAALAARTESADRAAEYEEWTCRGMPQSARVLEFAAWIISR